MASYTENQKAENLAAMGISISNARLYVEEGRYSPAINSIEIAESYAGQLKLDISNLIGEVKISAYQLAVETNVEKAQKAFNSGDLSLARTLANLADAYANSGKIDVPEGLSTLKSKIREIENAMPVEKTGDLLFDRLLAELDGESKEPANTHR